MRPVARSATNGRSAAFTKPLTATDARGYLALRGGGPAAKCAAKRRFLIGGLGAEPPGARRRRRRYRFGSPWGRTGTAGSGPATTDCKGDGWSRSRMSRPPRASPPRRARRRRRRPPPATEEPLWAVDRRGACTAEGFFEGHASAATGPMAHQGPFRRRGGRQLPLAPSSLSRGRPAATPRRSHRRARPRRGRAGERSDERRGRPARSAGRPGRILLLPSTRRSISCMKEGGAALARRARRARGRGRRICKRGAARGRADGHH